jgi:eukaryotic-like serine/threonine-protein kinase
MADISLLKNGMTDSKCSTIDDRYDILETLGKKAGRRTLLAVDRQTQERVIIKMLAFSCDLGWDDLKLFEREAQTLKTLSHPAIPRYLDSLEFDGPKSKGFALVQSYIPGNSLETYVQAGRAFTVAEIKAIALQILDILTYLHGRHPPAIHRDIKPSNIVVQEAADGSISNVYLVDFGSVQTLASTAGKTVTVVGTYGYMPPEQFGGYATPASDLYSLGATLVALATMAHPADLPQKDLRIDFDRVIPASLSLSPAFLDWLRGMTEPDAQQRFASAAAAKAALVSGKLRTPPRSSLGSLKWITLRLFGRSLGYSVLGGVWVAICALLFGTGMFVLPLYGSMFGLLYGVAIACPLIFFNAISVTLLTRGCFFPLKHPIVYRRSIAFASTLLCTTASLFVFQFLFHSGASLPGLGSGFFFTGIPSAIAGLAMGFSTKPLCNWYERQFK